ncbi:MAG: Gfo/Idh/MocA family oxidoreductase [Candidatus Sumerlaeota bacterium]|nr:Gfo/Idh/MocA family oxidoreductase [Candidatus Sumerlaeota bacterium]
MADKIRIGLIGCGGNMRGHVNGRLKTIPETEIVALADVSEVAMQGLANAAPQLAGAPRFADYRAMLDTVPMDAVVISSPHKFHGEQIVAALDHGLHVLTEKPMVCTVDEAKRVIAKRDEKKKLVAIGYQRHFQGAFRFARQCVKTGELGDVYFINAFQSQRWWTPASVGKWRFSLDLSGGGQLNDSGSHLLDIILWVTGLQPAEAFAFIDNRGAEVDVLTAASLRFTNGALMNLSVVGEASYKGMDEGEFIWGSKGFLSVTGTGTPVVTLTKDNASPPPPRLVRQVPPEEMPMGAKTPDHNFIDALLGRGELETPAECGLRVIQASQAIWESAKTGQLATVR